MPRAGHPITLAEFLGAVRGVPDNTPLTIGVRDERHLNHLIGELPVLGVQVSTRVHAHGIVLFVRGVS